MSSIKMKSSIDGLYHNYPIAFLDYDRLVSLYGSDPFSASVTDMPAAVSWAQTNYGASVDLNYYILDTPAITPVPFTSGLLAGCMADLVKPENSKENPVSICVQSSGFKAETGTKFADCFTLQGYSAGSAPPYDLNTAKRYYTAVTVSDHDKYNQTNTFTPPVTFSVNDRLSAKLTTTTGNTLGCCIGIGGTANSEFACVGTSYINASDPMYGADLSLSPAVQDNRDGFGNGGWVYNCNYSGGSYVPYYKTNSYATSSADPYANGAAPVVVNQITVQFVYTVINHKLYIGLACLQWSGDSVLSIYCGFIPEWFWGDFTITNPDLTPQKKTNYYGTDTVPSGGDGVYHYTNTTITIPTAENPFSGILHDGHGVHVYSISSGIYDEVCSTLWGDGTFSSALWKKWQNYKFNPIAAICGCHKLPYQLNPRGTFTQVDCRASGCPLTSSTSAYYVNSMTTVDYSCGSVSFAEKYFGNFMDYEPYTSVSLFLPFCGWVSVPADRVIGGVIYLDYRCDIVTGNVVAYIRCIDQTGEQTYMTTATGNAAMSIPITGNDNGLGTVLGAVTAGIGVAAAGLLTGGSGALIAGAAGAGLGINTGRHVLQQAGQVSGNVATINQLQPYLFVTIPIDVYSDLWRDLHGIRSLQPVTIGQLAGTGHTVFSDVHADTISCTSAEQAEIENILKSGVIL